VNGEITVTGAPSNVHILSYLLLACPASAPYDGNQFDPQCASESSGIGSSLFGSSPFGSSSEGVGLGEFSGRFGAHLEMNGDARRTGPLSTSDQQAYSIPLPAGNWILYPGYTTAFGPTVSAKGTPVTVSVGATSTTDLTSAYSKPTDGVVSGTTHLLDAPSDEAGLYGVEACPLPASTAPNVVCNVNTSQIGPNGDYLLDLPVGTWWIAELYEYDVPEGGGSFEGEPIAGPSTKLVVKAGSSYVVNLSATYTAP
jgi:hypothetical protein